MCPSLIEIGSKTAEKNSAQTNRQTDRHYENNGHLAVNQKEKKRQYIIHSSKAYPVGTAETNSSTPSLTENKAPKRHPCVCVCVHVLMTVM